MIRCIVPEQHSVVLPARRVSVEQPHKMLEEEGNDVAVRRGVRKAEPDLAISIESSDHRQTRRDSIQSQVALASLPCPQLSDEARLADPRFINIDDPLALLKQREHSERILLPLHFDFDGIRLRMQLLDLEEAEAEVLLQHLPHVLDADIVACLQPHCVTDLLSSDDRTSVIEQFRCCLYNFLSLSQHLLLSCSRTLRFFWLVLGLVD